MLEVLVTLVIVSVVLVMLTNVLFLALTIARKSFARSHIREEQNNIISKIEKDIRNAHFVESCMGEDLSASCSVALDTKYLWTTCTREDNTWYVCKKENPGTPNEKILAGMADDIVLKKFTFEEGYSDSEGRKTILVTMVVAHKDESLKLNNQVRQISISTRNFGVNF